MESTILELDESSGEGGYVIRPQPGININWVEKDPVDWKATCPSCGHRRSLVCDNGEVVRGLGRRCLDCGRLFDIYPFHFDD